MFSMEPATERDVSVWLSFDCHIAQPELLRKIRDRRCYLIRDNAVPVGVLRYGLFWDEYPFLNLIHFAESHRGKGFGTLAMRQWEEELRREGYKIVMTSTMADEGAQHFYRKLGYKDCGCLIKDIPPLVETMEIFLMKAL